MRSKEQIESSKTIPMSVRVDPLDLADIHAFYKSIGNNITEKGKLLRYALADFAEMVFEHRKCHVALTSSEAVQYLEAQGISLTSNPDRKREVVKLLSKESFEQAEIEACIIRNAERIDSKTQDIKVTLTTAPQVVADEEGE